MVKKIVLWSIYALFVGMLVWGAVNRTVAKPDVGSGGRQEELVGAQEGSRGQGGNRGGKASQGWDGGGGNAGFDECGGEIEDGGVNPGQGGFGKGNPSAGRDEIGPEFGSEDHEWLTLTGTITAYSRYNWSDKKHMLTLHHWFLHIL